MLVAAPLPFFFLTSSLLLRKIVSYLWPSLYYDLFDILVVLLDFVYDVVGDDLYVSFAQKSYPGQILRTINKNTGALSDPIDTFLYFQHGLEFDIANQVTYTCELNASVGSNVYYTRKYVLLLCRCTYLCVRYNGILGQSAEEPTSQMLYSFSGECITLRKGTRINTCGFNS